MEYLKLYEEFSKDRSFFNGEWYDLQIVKSNSISDREQYSIKFRIDKLNNPLIVWLDIVDGEEKYFLGNDVEDFKEKLNLELSKIIDKDPGYIFELAYIPKDIKEKYSDILNSKTWGLIGESNDNFIEDLKEFSNKFNQYINSISFKWENYYNICKYIINFFKKHLDNYKLITQIKNNDIIFCFKYDDYNMLTYKLDEETLEVESIWIDIQVPKGDEGDYFEFGWEEKSELLNILQKYLENNPDKITIDYDILYQIFPKFDKNSIKANDWGLLA
jgi:hypothetical protein